METTRGDISSTEAVHLRRNRHKGLVSKELISDAMTANIVESIVRLERGLNERLESITLKIDSLLLGQSVPGVENCQAVRTDGRNFSAGLGQMELSSPTGQSHKSGTESMKSCQPPAVGVTQTMRSLVSKRSTALPDCRACDSWADRVSMFDSSPAREQRSSMDRYRARKSGLEGRHSVHHNGMAQSDTEIGVQELLQKVNLSRNAHALNVWEFLDNPESSFSAHIYAKAMWCFTLITVCTTLVQTVDPPPLPGLLGGIVEMTIDVIFTVEILLRFAFCPSRRQFFMVGWNWVDIIAALPSLVLRLFLGPFIFDEEEEATRMFLLCTLPILRLLRLLRHFEQLHLLKAAFVDSLEALPVLLFTLLLIVLVTATMLFAVEQGDNIPRVSQALWLSIVTITTVGYGDVVPKTRAGTIITGVMVAVAFSTWRCLSASSLKAAFVDALEALPVLLFTLLLIVLVTATLLFAVEPRDNIPTVSKALWLSVVTVTTVGYGDVVPKSRPGSLITSVMVICSVLYMAMPLGIIGSAFCNVWNERGRILLIQRVREQLNKWGFTPRDIPVLFNLVDLEGSGALNLKEFIDLLNPMRLGLSEKRLERLFMELDVHGSGEISAQEFVRIIFPEASVTIYGAEPDSSPSPPDVPEPRELK
eukprot:CAMPEP_0170631072 /NCGR_PEP_ID=MMETSP0224-20130122/34401_1 /TAXON_ID=285029 /ORGANISM="Togula jolla, Strain CCCM 725" /LENGTH=647 /DNA_ID=CAMNT_0010959297 /DNA_START=1 /DNA_END=1945 /DNA_ORIENTATION=+